MRKSTPKVTRGAKKSFFEMTAAERAADVARFDKGLSFDETGPLSAKGKLLWRRAKRGRGRPPKPAGEKSARVLITVEPALLSKADRYARRRDLSRSELVAIALRQMMSGTRRSA
jgi:hypothetical protein